MSNRTVWAGAAAGIAAAGAATIAGQRRLRAGIAADPQNEELRRPPRGRPASVTSADGTSLHVESFGDEGTEGTFVLSHGWTETISYWHLVTKRLVDQGYRVVAYDQRGHGGSGRAPEGDYSVPRFGEDLEAVLATLPDRDRAIVAGHSLGGMSIASWAHDHEVEGRIGAVALMFTGVGDLMTESLLLPVPKVAQALSSAIAVRGFLGSRAPLPRFSTPLGHAMIRYTAFGPSAGPAQVAFYERMLLTCPPDVRADIGIALSELDLRQAVPRLQVPALVMAGENDRLTPPSHAKRVAEELPQLHRLIVLPETGHMGPLERPQEVSAALLELAAVVRERSVVAA